MAASGEQRIPEAYTSDGFSPLSRARSHEFGRRPEVRGFDVTLCTVSIVE